MACLPPVSGGKLCYRNQGPWLVLAKTSPVTYNIQRHARAEPEIVHVDKMLPYQADFDEELHSWLHGEESDGQRIAETQTTDSILTELPPESAVVLPHLLKVALLTLVLRATGMLTWRVTLRSPWQLLPYPDVKPEVVAEEGTSIWVVSILILLLLLQSTIKPGCRSD